VINNFNLHLVDYYNITGWIILEPSVPEATCDDVKRHLDQYEQKIAMSENWLPTGGVCQDDFINVIMMRNPMERLLSQYSHILRLCEKVNPKNVELCDLMTFKPTNSTMRLFNITTMMKYFDIVSDNYIARSLSTREAYQAPVGRMEEYSALAIQNLKKFDWILLIDNNKEGKNSTNILLELGLGFSSSSLPKENVDPQSHSLSLSDESRKILMDLNKFDHEIWKEAQRLHELDIKSLKYMEKYGKDLLLIWNQRRRGDSCCGRVCRSSQWLSYPYHFSSNWKLG
jgi:hypothetical protein